MCPFMKTRTRKYPPALMGMASIFIERKMGYFLVDKELKNQECGQAFRMIYLCLFLLTDFPIIYGNQGIVAFSQVTCGTSGFHLGTGSLKNCNLLDCFWH